MIRNVLSIAGSDPSGGAGIQADLKTFAACGTYGMAVVTALTAQNTRGVTGIHAVPPAFVAAQIQAIFDDIRVDAVKIGMVATAEIAEVIADMLEEKKKSLPILLDPVMVAKGGSPLLSDEAVAVVRDRLVPLATIVTPNLPEAAVLLGEAVATTREEMEAQGERLRQLGPRAVLVKGGHLEANDSPDLLAAADGLRWFEGERRPTRNTHGTGCTLSSAIAASLARGASAAEAVEAAKTYLGGAIAAADSLSVGLGHGPVHHFHQFW
ncbi:bifunctional hydroxymethylpyrimidine kinase/phosphomethylpyrimidine kinase [Rhizobium deserti]|uniref:hydroxymethylpyrimidine kinase n=1 Tax=Rhizobium deserti TaxID=2547961 RepID=A0A4R5U9T9_9HYPH|nr:bifunctional hydroxymethylpyrimidine kinase/phosphomethylpyrimidine kinase [Rhizobium deserti]TDK31383.1 bifunctional hydroxymethylpyrimidine kinase/phosphomethylpyrimidine kinase [Rhizobium deserti]